MKKLNLPVVLALLPLLTIAGTAAGYQQIKAHAPKSLTKSLAEKAQAKASPNAAGNGDYFIGTGEYKGEISAKSKIQENYFGVLYRVTKPGESLGVIVAGQDGYPLKASPGWTAKEIGRDAMWMPGACAQKPSWMIGDHLIMIDDGQYDGAKATHYYALYDTNTRKFTHFGGALVNDVQAKEKVLGINIEGGKLVFYIDQRDSSGPYVNSTSFKHSLAHHESYIIRRVIETPSLKYSDNRVPYDKPAFDDFHVTVAGQATDASSVEVLTVTSEGGGQTASGIIAADKTVTLKAGATSSDPVAKVDPRVNPYLAQLKAGIMAVDPGNAGSDQAFEYRAKSSHGLFVSRDSDLYLDLNTNQLSRVLQQDAVDTFTLGVE